MRYFSFYHLNLSFSSIEISKRKDVVNKCYWPLLNLSKKNKYKICIELTGRTLTEINQIDPKWVETFKKLLISKNCELIGSGWEQVISPIIPYQVNILNLKIGMDSYKKILGVEPTTFLINEMSVSKGCLESYIDLGIKNVIIDCSYSGNKFKNFPTRSKFSLNNKSLNIIYANSIIFQRFQRYIHSELSFSDFSKSLKTISKRYKGAIPLYSSDAEIFNFRPGRFSEENNIKDDEWKKIDSLYASIIKDGNKFIFISEINEKYDQILFSNLFSLEYPIIVKKQSKYNINRWAVSGRNDLFFNTIAFNYFLKNHNINDDLKEQKKMIELFSSDLRTHLTKSRYAHHLKQIKNSSYQFVNFNISKYKAVTKKNSKIYEDDFILKFNLNRIQISFLKKKGMAIKNLAFKSHKFKSNLGTIKQSDYYSSGQDNVDLFSGNIMLYDYHKRKKYTDLADLEYEILENKKSFFLVVFLEMNSNKLKKVYELSKLNEEVRISYFFDNTDRPISSMKLGYLTFFNFNSLKIFTHNGGKSIENFEFNENVNHFNSSLDHISSEKSMGITNGLIYLVLDDKIFYKVELDKSVNASNLSVFGNYNSIPKIFRISFPQIEIDDTLKEGGYLLPLTFKISPEKINLNNTYDIK